MIIILHYILNIFGYSICQKGQVNDLISMNMQNREWAFRKIREHKEYINDLEAMLEVE